MILSKFGGREGPWVLQRERAGWTNWNHGSVACSSESKATSVASTKTVAQRGHGSRSSDLHGKGRQRGKLLLVSTFIPILAGMESRHPHGIYCPSTRT